MLTRTDRPRSSLRRAFLGGRIIFNNNCSIFDCVIREMSDTHAVLELGSTFALPSVFVLETKPFKRRYDCNVERRGASSVEVSFLPANV